MVKIRDLSKLNESFRRKVDRWLEEVDALGIKIFVTESFRSAEDQEAAFKKGTSFLDGVTKLSQHQLGRAVDIAFDKEVYGELYPKDMTLWRKVADVAKKYKIDWGYDLWNFDKPHFQDSFIPLPNKIVSEEHKQLVEAAIYACKSLYNFGDEDMKPVASRHAKELRALLQQKE